MREAATVTDEKRCLGTNQDGSECSTGSALLLPSGFCFAHDPARGLDRSVAGTLGNLKSNAKRRRGIDVGSLETAADAKRISAKLVIAIAAGELPADQGRTALAALREWRQAYEADELEQRLAELEAAQKGRAL